jgi:phosphatidylserine decarboxylase
MLYFAYFFRNPNRVVAKDDDILYSPADGKVMDIKEFYDNEYLNEEATQGYHFPVCSQCAR